MLKKALRLTAQDIESLSQGKSVFGTLLSLRSIPAARLKFAVSVSKKTAALAVDRNALRRKTYKVLERFLTAGLKPASIMVMPKKECADASPEALAAELQSLFKKAGLDAK